MFWAFVEKNANALLFIFFPGTFRFLKKGWQTPNEGTNSYLATRWHCWWRRGRDGGGGEIGSNLFRDFFSFLRVCFKEKKKEEGGKRRRKKFSLLLLFSLSYPRGMAWRGKLQAVPCHHCSEHSRMWGMELCDTQQKGPRKTSSITPSHRAGKQSAVPQAAVCLCGSRAQAREGQGRRRGRDSRQIADRAVNKIPVCPRSAARDSKKREPFQACGQPIQDKGT